MRHRSAMSMIELVVAIVVMGIAVASLPLILLQTQRSTALAMQQEVILATTTRLAFILSHEWDTFSYDTTAGVSRVLDTTSSTSADNAFDTIDANSTRRIGHVQADGRRKLRNDKHVPSIDGGADWGNTILTDIDDFDDKVDTITVISADMDYTFNINLTSKIQYVTDAPASGNYNASAVSFNFNINSNPATPTNLKMISVTSSGSDSNITLRAFAANIGESSILKRGSW
ncbi:MAG: type IV pilus modification PilV family protein [Sulfurospirillum sp.]